MQCFIQGASIKDLQEHVTNLIEIFNKGGGFIFTQVHNIQSNFAPEKVIEIYNIAKGFR